MAVVGIQAPQELKQGEGVARTLSGHLDEKFDPSVIDPRGSRHMVLDLSGISHVSSYGVREWVRAIGAVRSQLESLYFVRVSPRITDQFNMVMGFDGGGALLSFYAHYLCESCGQETLALFDVQLDKGSFASLEAPVRQCQVCGKDAALDDDPSVLFEYVRSSAPPAPPAPVMSLLRHPESWLDEIPGVRVTTRQTVNLNTTVFKLAGIIDASFPTRRIVEGGGDAFALALDKVSHFDRAGFDAWRNVLYGLAKQGRVALSGCPPVVLRRFIEDFTLLGQADVSSLTLPLFCKKCRQTYWQHVNARELGAWLNSEPHCAVCNEVMNLADRREQFRGFGKGLLQPRPAANTAPTPTPAPQHKKPAAVERRSTDQFVENFADKYEVLCKLAEGGMAEVYLVRQHGAMGFRRLAVIKKVRSELLTDDRMIRLFLDEAKLAARIDHPNVIRVYDLGRVEGSFYMVIEYVHGRSLAQTLGALGARNGRVPPSLAALIIADLCKGLARAHMPDSNGTLLVHRDVTPNNVVVTFDGVVKLLDFGLAGHRKVKGDDNLILGNPAWVAPEIYLNKDPMPQTDIWGAGLILLSLVTGRNPFRKPKIQQTAYSVVHDKLKRPWFSPLPRRLFKIVKRALEKDPNKRYSDASVMEEDLRRAAVKLGGERNVADWMRKQFTQELRIENDFVQRCAAANLVDALLTRAPEEVAGFFKQMSTQTGPLDT